MTDWQGSGTTVASGVGNVCEYLSISDVRSSGSDVSDLTDVQIQQRLDTVTDLLDNALGHRFCRFARIHSEVSRQLTIDGTGVTIDSTTLPFATYTTLGALCDALAALPGLSLEVFPEVLPGTPSTMLMSCSTLLGPGYANRVTLGTIAVLYRVPAVREKMIILPLPLVEIVEIMSNDVVVPATSYRSDNGGHVIERTWGTWTGMCSSYATQRLFVLYKTSWTVVGRRLPAALRQLLLQAFDQSLVEDSARDVSSASLLGFSYSLGSAATQRAIDLFSAPAVRMFTRKPVSL
jgi:hypothetical protein